MSHHGGPDDKGSELLREMFAKQDTTDHIRELNESLGATGKYPQGSLSEDDEGGLKIGLTAVDGKVVLAFGKAVNWIGFDAEQARDLAQTLLNRAQECDGVEACVWRVGSGL